MVVFQVLPDIRALGLRCEGKGGLVGKNKEGVESMGSLMLAGFLRPMGKLLLISLMILEFKFVML